ncbi:glycosyltransferase family 4 protein [Haladaptatus halobius]|uniref:glycosyltransferase family 4 protein n=1 Tax=Haladaptatus halobius TaxID=2884875 RepID=UPI001D09A5D5|nr:glycosyltransferase family 4 protein [Haladaptatus halobius]
MARLALIWETYVPANRNSTRFQRAHSLTENYDCAFYTRADGGMPEEISIPESAIHVCPGKSLVSHLLFPFWVVYRILVKDDASVDAVHTSYHLFCILAGFICSLGGKIWILDIWDHPRLKIEFLQKSEGIVWKMALMFYRAVYVVALLAMSHADLIVLSLHSQFAETNGLPGKKVVNVPNGTDLALYDDVQTETDDGFNIVYVGFVQPSRGIDTVIEALSDFDSTNDQWTATIIGPATDGDERQLRRFARRKNIAENVDFAGRLSHEETVRRIANSDACLYPFPRQRVLRYIYPIKLFEYMALGKPIVASRLEGATELLEHDVTGLLVEPGDAEAFSEALCRLSEDEDLRAEIGGNAARAVERYDWNGINDRFIAAIDRCFASQDDFETE